MTVQGTQEPEVSYGEDNIAFSSHDTAKQKKLTAERSTFFEGFHRFSVAFSCALVTFSRHFIQQSSTLQAPAQFLSPFGNPLLTERCSTLNFSFPPSFFPYSSLPLRSTTRLDSMIRSNARRLLTHRTAPSPPPRILQTIHQQRPERIHNECRLGKRYLSSSRVVAGPVKEFKLADIGEGITECEIVKW